MFDDSHLNIMQMNYDNPYNLLRVSSEKWKHTSDYMEIELNSLMEMFEYNTTLFDDVDINNIEMILRVWGCVGFTYLVAEDNAGEAGTLVYGFAYMGGKRNNRGIGDKITINLLNGKVLRRSPDGCVLGFNNGTKTGDRILYWFAKQFTEIDISQVNNVRYSRQAPIFVAKNNKLRQFIETMFKKIVNGEMTAVADDSILNKGDKVIDTVNLTDVSSIDKLQYLDTYHNALLRRIYTLYGMPLCEGVKLAQQSTDEVNANHDSSQIIPLNNLKWRQKMCEDLAAFTGESITVDFCELLKQKMEQPKMVTEKEGEADDEI